MHGNLIDNFVENCVGGNIWDIEKHKDILYAINVLYYWHFIPE